MHIEFMVGFICNEWSMKKHFVANILTFFVLYSDKNNRIFSKSGWEFIKDKLFSHGIRLTTT